MLIRIDEFGVVNWRGYRWTDVAPDANIDVYRLSNQTIEIWTPQADIQFINTYHTTHRDLFDKTINLPTFKTHSHQSGFKGQPYILT